MIVVFFHVPKTAGSSINVAARSALMRGYTVVVEDTHHARLSARLRRLAERPETYFVQGHITPSLDLLSIPMRRVTVLRQPLERLLSHFCYCFDRRHYDLNQLNFFRSRKNYSSNIFDGEDLIAWVTRFNMDNFQVRFLTAEYNGKITDRSLARAITILSSFDCVATTDRLTVFFKFLGEFVQRDFEVDKLPHTNRSDRSRLRLSREDQEYIAKEFCQKDQELVQVAMDRDDQLDRPSVRYREQIEKTAFREPGSILQLLSTNTTMHEVFIKAKRRSLGIAAQTIEILGKLAPKG